MHHLLGRLGLPRECWHREGRLAAGRRDPLSEVLIDRGDTLTGHEYIQALSIVVESGRMRADLGDNGLRNDHSHGVDDVDHARFSDLQRKADAFER